MSNIDAIMLQRSSTVTHVRRHKHERAIQSRGQGGVKSMAGGRRDTQRGRSREKWEINFATLRNGTRTKNGGNREYKVQKARNSDRSCHPNK